MSRSLLRLLTPTCRASLSIMLLSLTPLPATLRAADEGDAVVDFAVFAEEIEKIDSEIQALAETEAALQEEILKRRREATDSSVLAVDVARQQLEESVQSLEAQLKGMALQRGESQVKIETMLRESGQWISFTDQIAPIFQARCVACHNVRNAQGRYNMATFSAIRSMAESGRAIEPGDAEGSLLVQLIEDGSMPYDADPLSDDQITLIKKWVDLGARIDSSADLHAPLIRLMPRFAQPKPPARYVAPIPISAIAVDPSSKLVASSGYHEVLLWSLQSGELIGRISNIAERIYGLAFHPDGKRVAVASGTPGQWGEVKMLDVHSGELLADLLVSEDAMFDVCFSPDGNRLAACGADGSIAIFSIDASNLRPLFIEDHSDWVNSISWSPDGKLLVSTSRDKTAKVFDAGTGVLKITFSGHNQNVTAARFLAGSSQVLSAGDDRRIRIWNVTDAKQDREISGLATEMNDLHLLGSGQILSAGSDGKIRIHNSSDGKLIRELASSSDWISSLAATADEKVVLFGDHAGQIHRIPVDPDTGPKHSWKASP